MTVPEPDFKITIIFLISGSEGELFYNGFIDPTTWVMGSMKT